MNEPGTRAPGNPMGTISLPIALRRFQASKWPTNPFSTLLEYSSKAWDASVEWDFSAGSIAHALAAQQRRIYQAMFPSSDEAQRERYAARQLDEEWNPDFVETPSGIGLSARELAVDRIDAAISNAFVLEGDEFLGAFKTGQLAAIGTRHGEVEAERWDFADMRMGAVWGSLEIQNFQYDWSQLYVPEADLRRWINSYPVLIRDGHTGLTGSQQLVRRVLQTLVELELIGRAEAETLCGIWGYRRLEDTVDTLREDAAASGPETGNVNAGGKNHKAQSLAVDKAVDWLVQNYMSKSPQPTHTQDQLLPLAQEHCGKALSGRAFKRVAWSRAVAMGYWGWSGGGTPPSRRSTRN